MNHAMNRHRGVVVLTVENQSPRLDSAIAVVLDEEHK